LKLRKEDVLVRGKWRRLIRSLEVLWRIVMITVTEVNVLVQAHPGYPGLKSCKMVVVNKGNNSFLN